MPEAALAIKPTESATSEFVVRRFALPDIDRQGLWIAQRLLKQYPHLTQHSVIGWLRSLLYSSEHMFLYNDNGVALAQLERATTLVPQALVRERFVFAKPGFETQAAAFYVELQKWARNIDAHVMIVLELSDVPPEAAKAALGRIFTRQEQFARIRE